MTEQLTRCLDADLCKRSDTCLRVRYTYPQPHKFLHFWNGNNDIPCNNYVDPVYNHFVSLFNEQT